MKVFSILTIVSIFLAGLVKAAPVDELKASRIVAIGESGEKDIDFDIILSMIEAIDESNTEDDSSITDKEEQFVEKLMEVVQEEDLMGSFLSKLVRASQSQNGFKEGVESTESSQASGEDSQDASASSEMSETISSSEKRQIEEVVLEARTYTRSTPPPYNNRLSKEQNDKIRQRFYEKRIRQSRALAEMVVRWFKNSVDSVLVLIGNFLQKFLF